MSAAVQNIKISIAPRSLTSSQAKRISGYLHLPPVEVANPVSVAFLPVSVALAPVAVAPVSLAWVPVRVVPEVVMVAV